MPYDRQDSLYRAYLRTCQIESQELGQATPCEGVLIACTIAKRNLAPLLRDSFVMLSLPEENVFESREA